MYSITVMHFPSKTGNVLQLNYSSIAKIIHIIDRNRYFTVKFSQNRKDYKPVSMHVYLQTILWIHQKISPKIIKHDGVFVAIFLKLSPNDT